MKNESRSMYFPAWMIVLSCVLAVSFLACSGTEEPVTSVPATPVLPQDLEDDEYDLMLDAQDPGTWPEGAVGAIDALQTVVDNGGSILLAGTFDLGEAGQILIGQEGNPVTLAGDGTAESGRPATKILGGERSFLFVAPVVARIQNLWFDGFVHSGIEVAYNEALVVKGNTFTDGKVGPAPATGRPEVWSILIREAETEVSGTILIRGNTIENNEYPVGAWYGPGFYGGGVGVSSFGAPGDAVVLYLSVVDNFFDKPGMLGGLIVNNSWTTQVTAKDNVIHQMPDWSYTSMLVSGTPAPVIKRNEMTNIWWYGIRTYNIDGAAIVNNTFRTSVDAWALSVPVDSYGTGGTHDVTIAGNAFVGTMDRGISLTCVTGFQVVNNDFRQAACYSSSSHLLALSSWHGVDTGPFHSTGNSIKNNNYPVVNPGEGWCFGMYRAGDMEPNLSNPMDNMLVGGNTEPVPVFYDETDTNLDPEIYEGMNEIIFPSFWKGTAPDHRGHRQGDSLD